MLTSNSYFDGKVMSIAFQTEALPATVGVMEQGEYRFDTSQKETITVVSGALEVQLPGDDQWQTYRANDTFVVSANKSFQLKVATATAYLCTYE
jgi:uncharacterized protein YaiE (UPF0345 family)